MKTRENKIDRKEYFIIGKITGLFSAAQSMRNSYKEKVAATNKLYHRVLQTNLEASN